MARWIQRLLGGGDARASRSDVEEVVRRENFEELAALMPAAASLVARGEFEVLPDLWDAVH